MNQINFNGKLQAKDAPIFKANNRAFHYGDGLFETIRMFEGCIPFLAKHLNRLREAMHVLQMDGIELFQVEFVQNEIYKLVGTNGNFRIRLNVFRAGAGLYTPQTNQVDYLIEAQKLANDNFILNKKGLVIGLYDKIHLNYHEFSSLKTCNALPYILASKYKKDQQLDDCILLNSHNRIAECSSSNIFLIKGKELWTPPLTEACLNGICRSLILKIAHELSFTIREIPLSLSQLKIAEEVWLSNSISGIRWVAKFQNNNYRNEWARKFVQSLQDMVKF